MQLLDINRPLAAARSDSPQQWAATVRIQPLDRGNSAAGSPAATPDRWHFAPISPAQRCTAEQFIATQFLKAYGARIGTFMPDLMGLYDQNTLAAVCGLRVADTGPLFLERYLEHPADMLLDGMSGRPVNRHSLVEVGNLSISRPGYARHLVYWLTQYLHQAGREWVVFSAVPALRNNFLRLGIPLVTLGAACADRLPDAEAATWGSYYAQRPQVTAVRVEAAFKALGENTCKR